MRIQFILLIFIMLLAASCAGTKKNKGSSQNQATESNIPGTTTRRTLARSTPVEETKATKGAEAEKSEVNEKKVTEVEKKIVADDNQKPNFKKYFVIVGSFRDPENARKQRAAFEKEGFKSEILKTEEGLYRISVMATNDVNEARNEVRRIWAIFPQYSDTWMLISMNP